MELILLYIPLYGPQSRKLEAAIQSVLEHKSFTVLRDLESLEAALLRGLSTPYLIVLSIPRHEDLLRILALKEELIRSNVVVVLPDQDPAAGTYVHTLRPRFVAYAEDDCEIVAEVVERLFRDLETAEKTTSKQAAEAVWVTIE
jgi:hypothetical protein